MIVVFCIGVLIAFVGWVSFLFAAFRTDILWGFGCLLLSPVSLVYLVLHWQDAKKPFFLELIGLVLMYASGSAIA